MNSPSILRETTAGHGGPSPSNPAAVPAGPEFNRAFWPQPRLTYTCAYCGSPCLGRTCKAHRDLPQLEYGGF